MIAGPSGGANALRRPPGYAGSHSALTTAGDTHPAAMHLAGISTTLDMYATCIERTNVSRAVRAGERAAAYGLGDTGSGTR